MQLHFSSFRFIVLCACTVTVLLCPSGTEAFRTGSRISKKGHWAEKATNERRNLHFFVVVVWLTANPTFLFFLVLFLVLFSERFFWRRKRPFPAWALWTAVWRHCARPGTCSPSPRWCRWAPQCCRSQSQRRDASDFPGKCQCSPPPLRLWSYAIALSSQYLKTKQKNKRFNIIYIYIYIKSD